MVLAHFIIAKLQSPLWSSFRRPLLRWEWIVTNWYALSLRVHRKVPATMLRPNSEVSWDFHHRRMKFLISHVCSLPENILCADTFFWNQKSLCCQLPSEIWQPISFLQYARNICHLYSLLAPIKTIMNSILSGWTPHIPILFTIAVARIHLINALSFQKWLYIRPSNFSLEWLWIVLTQNQVAIRIILLQLLWKIRLSEQLQLQ